MEKKTCDIVIYYQSQKDCCDCQPSLRLLDASDPKIDQQASAAGVSDYPAATIDGKLVSFEDLAKSLGCNCVGDECDCSKEACCC